METAREPNGRGAGSGFRFGVGQAKPDFIHRQHTYAHLVILVIFKNNLILLIQYYADAVLYSKIRIIFDRILHCVML